MKIRVLVIWSIIGRGIRFFLEGAIILTLGAKAKPFIEENFTLLDTCSWRCTDCCLSRLLGHQKEKANSLISEFKKEHGVRSVSHAPFLFGSVPLQSADAYVTLEGTACCLHRVPHPYQASHFARVQYGLLLLECA